MIGTNDLLSRFEKVKKNGQNSWMVQCPCHADKRQSLSITRNDDGKLLFRCFAGCETKDILAAVGLSFPDIFPDRPAKQEPAWKKDLEAEYRYTDKDGKYLYSKLRYRGKRLKYARIIGDNITYGKTIKEASLYNLKAFLEAKNKGLTVYYAEGEKDIDTLRKIGLPGTTAGGTGDWKPGFAHFFTGACIVILADNDDAGKKLAQQVFRDISRYAYKFKIVIPSKRNKGDVTDYINEGYKREDLLKLTDDEPWSYAPWVDVIGKTPKINQGLLAEVIGSNNDIITAAKPGANTETVYWYDHGFYHPLSDEGLIAEILPYVPKAKVSATMLQNVAKLIRYNSRRVSFEDLDQQEQFINLQNGLYDIHSGAVRPHDPELLSSIQLPVIFQADDQKEGCWDRFIESVCTDEEGVIDLEMMAVLQEWLGLIFSPIHGYRLKKALVLYSPEGNTGKSVLINLIGSIIGENNMANVSFQEMGGSRWATGRAFGKRVIAVGDQGSERIESSAVFKQMIGGDLLSAEMKGKQGFDYRFNGVVLIACNTLPVFVDDKGNHMAERFMFLPFRNVIKQADRDPLLIDKLKREKNAVFLWAMKGLKRLIDNGYVFSECQSADEVMELYRADHDTLYRFIRERCVVTGEDKDRIRKKQFEDAYISYCEEMELRPLAKSNIRSRAASLGFRCRLLQGIEYYKGLYLQE